jgi:hypothetical protein
MLILLGAVLVGMFGIAGTFLSIEEKQRRDSETTRSTASSRPLGQAISGKQ